MSSGNLDGNEAGEASQKVPAPVFSYILLGCILVVFLFQLATGFEETTLLAYFDKELFLEKKEYWRIITGGLLHGSMAHIAFNGYALYGFGRYFEILSGRPHLPVVFLLSIISGGFMSLIFQPDINSLGASGGVMGIVGYLAVYGYRRRKLLTDKFLKAILLNIAIIAALGIFLLDSIDNFAHLGGCLAGAAYGFFQIPRSLEKDPRISGGAAKIAGFLSLGLVVVFSIFSIVKMLEAARS